MAALLLALPLGLAELDGLPEEVLLADELADPEPEAEVGDPPDRIGASLSQGWRRPARMCLYHSP